MPSTIDDVELQLRNVIDNLYNLMVHNFDLNGTQSGNASINEIQRLVTNLGALTTTSRALLTTIPRDLIEYTEAGRNPNIYNREFVEKVQLENQELKGKSQSFAAFRDILAEEITMNLPELKQDVQNIKGSEVRYVNGATGSG